MGEGIGIVSTADDSSNQETFAKMPDLDGVAAAKISPPPKARGNPGDENDEADEDDDPGNVGTSEGDNGQESAGYGQGPYDDDDDNSTMMTVEGIHPLARLCAARKPRQTRSRGSDPRHSQLSVFRTFVSGRQHGGGAG